MAETLRVPELGEGIDSVDVVAVLVEVGDTVTVEQSVIEVETEKAAVEVPSEVAGIITEIHVKAGDAIETGAPIVTIEPGDVEAQAADDTPAAAAVEVETEASPAEEVAETEIDDSVTESPPQPETIEQLAPRRAATEAATTLVPAAPTVRRFARELGADITQVSGSGPGGRISIDDVKAYASQRLSELGSPKLPTAAPALPDMSAWGPIRREAMSKIRRVTAKNMAHAWSTVPQVTHHDHSDITRLEALRKRFKGRVDNAGGKLTVTAILVKVAASALKAHPTLNASLDTAAEQIVFKDYCHIGVAVDTEHGLLVPVIRDADSKNVTQIAIELDDLAARARERKLKPDEMQGASFTISNLGGIGGTGFSPIVNWPQVAILGVSRGRMEPIWTGADFEPRLILPLSLSYDHRLVDGADAARFLRWIAEALEQPLLLALEG
jgi:pyruvate dehydrogenase E2 component (dihydrolipoamide acetyltransferase)